ncbi:TerB family tellurite resistance protein [Hymenobacter sp. CRA2]|uniref:TerB family tellurite resistance protein n=1 Tax=Hymenobacter sp. CRA2 TaxID=1955620 RepID=UPI0009902752|nr:TerB family tellurite resistance protein [Hymenobacter sp. CRA2]OON65872.1 hypothetical protein B0919_22855 [Hymenobacter sp. CRA2]
MQTKQTAHPLDKLLDTQQKKLAFFQNLILVAAADGRLDKDEGDFLVQIGQRLGLSYDDVRPIADNLSVLSFVVAADGLQRTLELQTLVQMMLQDGQIDPREYGLCLEYANRVGYNKQILDDMVTQLAGGAPDAGRNPPTVS